MTAFRYSYMDPGNLTVSHPSLMLGMSACGSVKVRHLIRPNITVL